MRVYAYIIYSCVYKKPRRFLKKRSITNTYVITIIYKNPSFLRQITFILSDVLSIEICILMISSVNVTKSAGNCAFGHIYRRNP